MLALLPDARMEVIEHAGHFEPLEQKDSVAELLINFFCLKYRD